MIYDVIPQLPANGYTVCEFFAGGGLMGMGVKRSGCNIVWANDFEKTACAAYGHNVGRHIVHGDITKIKAANIPSADIYCGGPPCQDYSVAGEGAGEEGVRGALVWRYLAIIKLKQPKAFLFENVKGLITKKHMRTFQRLLKRFERIGFNVSWQLVNSWDYGVAQKRERVFIVGIRKDMGIRYQFPDPKPEEYRTQVLRDVIGDLPEPNQKAINHVQTESTTVKPHQVLSGQRSYRAEWDKPGKTVNVCRLDHAEIHPGPIENHIDYPITTAQFEHAKAHLQGYNDSLDKPARVVRAKAENFLDEVAAAVENHDPKELSEKAMDYLTRDPRHLQKHRPPTMDEAAPTLPAVVHKGVPYGLHYPENHTERHVSKPRRFTVRECLRIQSVPDAYVLPDSLSLSAQYRIVGNGVASKVAYDLVRALVDQLNGANPMKLGQQDLFDLL